MSNRPPTDYITTQIDDNTIIIKSAEKDIKNNIDVENAEKRLEDSARIFASAINRMVCRDALTEDDIETIINNAKKEAGL